MLTVKQARRFYDWFGSWEDWQAFYEDAAVISMLDESDFEHATIVFEFGSGTGRFAEQILSQVLAPTCRYVGIDISRTMVGLAQQRLQRCASRAEVRQSNGSCTFVEKELSVDRVVSTYVLDMIATEQICLFLKEARRVLTADGMLCLVSLADGSGRVGTLVSRRWRNIHAMAPYLAGGCRPLGLTVFITRTDWQIRHARLIRSIRGDLPSDHRFARGEPKTIANGVARLDYIRLASYYTGGSNALGLRSFGEIGEISKLCHSRIESLGRNIHSIQTWRGSHNA